MTADPDPIARFRAAWQRARAGEPLDGTAVALATVDASGRPSCRMVLLKGVDERGFVFYTNRESAKGRQLAANPYASLCFHWPSTREQVRIDGPVEQVTDPESDAYFAARPRSHQVAAWASSQSNTLEGGREALLARMSALEARYAGHEVPRPPHWGGYRVVAERIEFWHHEEDRLHRRELYERDGAGWRVSILQP
jgi:pyridoxamine 5'-phosphate oxidase